MTIKNLFFNTSRSLLMLTLAGLLMVLAACGGNGGSAGKETATPAGGGDSASLPKEIRIGYQVSPNGELTAKALGLAEKKFPGVKISWLKFESGRDVNTAIASGSIDFGLVGTPPGASGVAQGLPYQIYYIHDVIGESEALVVQENSAIQSLADLKGKTIATTFGSTSHFSFLSALKQENIDPSTLKIIDMQAPDLLAAWQRGDIDGAFTWQPVQSKLLAQKGKIVITSKEIAEKGALTGEFGVVHNDFITKYPDAVISYIEVLDEGTKYYRDHPQEASEALSKELGLTPEETLKAMNEITVLDAAQQKDAKYMGTPDQPGQFAALLKATADFLVEQKSIKEAPDVTVFQKAIRNDLYDKF
ncbi:taurine ABC transporter substrate-binding protein [Paenibacillus radicis (ex Gao et al. 2016)]|uniref:Glycine/betaine ABC transporter substrate-binding protein n=1 Tax=Paenibacillus radicis (ex Gao et al. 2016) TaxID=1737354 RepID=A0A917LW90_9BACL|nr:aliphatic sulfonate ABC transporter substrate-binding protein [Paenibacillus radicis (ex Gao et al. 2016)]GGG60802.1 glycine/betaine ABC transporter substrate-binding protein [Paenibacillus radicis (ex Gao et al. 2016)]